MAFLGQTGLHEADRIGQVGVDGARIVLATTPDAEKEELANIYIGRGLTPALARQVADQLTERDALGARARDELGMLATTAARPIQAALSSAGVARLFGTQVQ